MANDVDWDQAEEVKPVAGSYIGWGDTPGQVVAGTVVEFSRDGGTDFNGNDCPQITLELLDEAPSYSKKQNEWTKVAAGERAVVNGGQASLKRALVDANPKPTDKVRIEFIDTYKTDKGTGKEFSIKVIRGSGNPWDD